jgi:hypothetical protein
MGKVKDKVSNLSGLDILSLVTATPISAATDPMRPLDLLTGSNELDDPGTPPEFKFKEQNLATKKKRKQGGRQSTILTSSLSDATTTSPTLLGQ